MSLTIAYPSKAVITTGTTVRLGLLPYEVRTPPTYVVTIAAPGAPVAVVTSGIALKKATTISVDAISAAIPNRAVVVFQNGVRARLTTAAASGATSLVVEPLSRDIPNATDGSWSPGSLAIGSMFLPVSATLTPIDAGDILMFPGNNRVVVTDYAPAGSTTLDVLPLAAAATTGQTATTKGLLSLAGCTEATPAPAPKAVESTTYLSGIGKEQIMVAVSNTVKFGYNRVVGDKGAELLSNVMSNSELYDREIWFEISVPNDGLYSGAAIITGASRNMPVQDIVRMTVDLQVQGTSYSYVPAQ